MTLLNSPTTREFVPPVVAHGAVPGSSNDDHPGHRDAIPSAVAEWLSRQVAWERRLVRLHAERPGRATQ